MKTIIKVIVNLEVSVEELDWIHKEYGQEGYEKHIANNLGDLFDNELLPYLQIEHGE